MRTRRSAYDCIESGFERAQPFAGVLGAGPQPLAAQAIRTANWPPTTQAKAIRNDRNRPPRRRPIWLESSQLHLHTSCRGAIEEQRALALRALMRLRLAGRQAQLGGFLERPPDIVD